MFKNMKREYLIGSIFIVVGLLFLTGNFISINFGDIIKFAIPLVFIVLGLYLYQRDSISNISSFIFMGFGILILGRQLNIFKGNLFSSIFAIIIIGFGLYFIFMSKGKKLFKYTNDEFFKYFIIFGGLDRKPNTDSLLGGVLFAIFGGISLDIEEVPLNRKIEVDSSVMFGGADIYVPENAKVKVNVVALFGGVDRKNINITNDDEYDILVKGAVLFGGLDIKTKQEKF